MGLAILFKTLEAQQEQQVAELVELAIWELLDGGQDQGAVAVVVALQEMVAQVEREQEVAVEAGAALPWTL